MRTFFFEKESVLPLCYFRAGFGLLLFIETLMWFPHGRELFSNDGFHLGFWSQLAPSPLAVEALIVVLLLSSLALAFGFYTRSALAITLLLRSYFYGIDLINEKSIGSIALVILVILLFSPCHKRFSLDARKNKEPKPLELVAGIWRKLVLLEVAQVYFFAGLVKLSSSEWLSGNTLFYIFRGRWATETGIWLSGWLPFWYYGAFANATILFEILAFLLFVKRYRLKYALVGLCFHVGIQLTLYIEVLGMHFIWILLSLVIIPESKWPILPRTQAKAA